MSTTLLVSSRSSPLDELISRYDRLVLGANFISGLLKSLLQSYYGCNQQHRNLELTG
jgi:hypothetical protein